MPPNSPEVAFPKPKATHSLFPEPLLPPISSRTDKVSRDSIRPTRATIIAVGIIIIIALSGRIVQLKVEQMRA